MLCCAHRAVANMRKDVKCVSVCIFVYYVLVWDGYNDVPIEMSAKLARLGTGGVGRMASSSYCQNCADAVYYSDLYVRCFYVIGTYRVRRVHSTLKMCIIVSKSIRKNHCWLVGWVVVGVVVAVVVKNGVETVAEEGDANDRHRLKTRIYSHLRKCVFLCGLILLQTSCTGKLAVYC